MHINPGVAVNQDTLPSADDLAQLGLLDGWIRCLVTDVDRFDRDLAALGWPPSLKVCALLEGQTGGIGGDFAGWLPTVEDFARRFAGRVQAVECANELDLWHWQPPGGFPPNPLLTPEFAAELVRQVAPHLRAAGMQVIAPAVASERWVEYLAAMTAALGDAADYQAFHPYGKKIDNFPPHEHWGELGPTIDEARRIAGRPLALTELGVKLGEVGGLEGQAEYVGRLFGLMALQAPDAVAFFCYFAWKDRVGVPGEGAFGLVEPDGRWRDACTEFQRRCGGPRRLDEVGAAPGAPRFRMGFEQWARLEPALLGEPLEDEISPVPGMSLQRTSRGVLFWSAVDGGVHLFQELGENTRHVWRDGWPTSQRVMV